MMNGSKKAKGQWVIGFAQRILGSVIACFSTICLVAGVKTQGLASVTGICVAVVFVICITAGVLLILRGTERLKLALLFERYTSLLTADPFHSIDKMAAAAGVPVGTAMENVSKLIRRKFFVNAHIDYDRKCLVLDRESASPAQ